MTFAARQHTDTQDASPPLGATVVVASYEDIGLGSALCSITFQADGNVRVVDESGSSIRYAWKTGGGTGGDYQVRWQNIAGTLSFGTAGSYLRLNVDRVFGVLFDGVGAKQCNGVVTIQQFAAPNTQLASASVSLRAVGENPA